MRRGTQPETVLRLAIFHRLGQDPGLLVLRNAVGQDATTRVVYGLGTGSPDLVVILAPWGHLLGLEVKVPGKTPQPEQTINHALWRRKGATVVTVWSVEDGERAVAETRATLTARWPVREDEAEPVPPSNVTPIRKGKRQ